jgi:hypothetical protein
MKPQHIFEAIENLAPGAEITFSETDLDTLVWYSPEIEQPSKEEIFAEVERVIASPKPIVEPTVEEKLASVGLSIDDLKSALGLEGN